MSDHTPEPWTADIPYIHAGDTEENIVEVLGDRMSDEVWANARRIVACVNACAGISNELLEQHPAAISEVYAQSLIETEAELTALRQQVADLRAALARLLLYVEDEERFKAKFGGPEFEGSAVSEEYWLQHTVKEPAITALASTQPQEVQP